MHDLNTHRSAYGFFSKIESRWMDNDVYGHVNNVIYYSYFDTVVNRYLIDHGGLDFHNDPVISVVVESSCRYLESIEYPDLIDAGLRIGHLGNSSVVYQIALFKAGVDDAAAIGHFVHVFVDRQSRRPVPIPKKIHDAFSAITKVS